MKRILPLLLTLLLAFSLAGCGGEDSGGGEADLNDKDILGTYIGTGSVTKEEVVRKQADIDNGRYLFELGDKSNAGGEFTNVVFEFEEDEDGIWFTNKATGLSGKLIYDSSSGQWEGKVDYPIGTLELSADFSREDGGIHARIVFTQSFERETFENPEPTDGVNEVTMELEKTK